MGTPGGISYLAAPIVTGPSALGFEVSVKAGAVGCRRSVSLKHALRYGSRLRCSTVIGSPLVTPSTSFRAAWYVAGFLRRYLGECKFTDDGGKEVCEHNVHKKE